MIPALLTALLLAASPPPLPAARPLPVAAHPVPGSAVLLDIHETSVTAQLRLPVQDLVAASGLDLDPDLPDAPAGPGGAIGPGGPVTSGIDPFTAAAVGRYLRVHMRPTTIGGRVWRVRVGVPALAEDEQAGTGPFQDLVVTAELIPPPGGDVRHFQLGYDAVVHQVATHLAVVSLRDGGPTSTIGVIATDVTTMGVRPLTVHTGGPGAGRALGLASAGGALNLAAVV